MSESKSQLIEYQEVLAERRHYDVLRWTVVGLVYPTAFAAIGFAGARWGFTSGRAFLVGALGILWLVAGSLVFAQIHFYGSMRLVRARELEKELGFENLSHETFDKPKVPKQPWYTRNLAWWFATAVPCVAFVGSLVWGWILVKHYFPDIPADRDIVCTFAGFALLIVTLIVFLVRIFIKSKGDGPRT